MIFHKWKLVFVGIPKNASVSIHTALSNKTDNVAHTHLGISEIFSNEDEDLLLDYQSFCVVRNPFDRFYSAWKHNHPHPGPTSIVDYRNAFNEFVNNIVKPGKVSSNISHEHYWPQYKFVTLNKRVVVDNVLKFENLQEDWIKFQNNWNSLSLTSYSMNLRLPKENSSQIQTPWNEVYNHESIEIIRNLYRLDFEIFNYEPKLI